MKPAFDPLTAPLDDVIGMGDGMSESAEPGPRVALQPAAAPEPVIEASRPIDPPDPGDHSDLGEPRVEVSDVDVMLSMLAAEHRRTEPASGLAERLGDRSTRVAVMVGGTVIVGAVLFAILTALGALV